MSVDPSIFKAYDIRGTFPDQINAEVAELIGRALADFLPGHKGIAVGRDMRVDSSELAGALIKGITAQGRDVTDIGLVSTDMAAFASGFYDLAGAAMITASHNPGQYNGLKLYGSQAQSIAATSGEDKIKQAVLEGKFKDADKPGTVTKLTMDGDWVHHALLFVDYEQWPRFTLAVDAANGMMGKIFPVLETKVPMEVTSLYFELDGSFPNHQPNPAIVANLADLTTTVSSRRLQLGIAFDGDGDRAFFVDETGAPLSGSTTAAILIRDQLSRNPESTVLYDVRMSRIVPETIAAAGGKAIGTPVGGGYIRPLAREHNAILACEGAGHYYFRDNYYSDSGLITALLILDIMSRTRQKLSELAKPFNKYAASGELNFQIADPKATLTKVEQAYQSAIHDRIDGISIDQGDWWFNLRASNTEPLVRLNLEATSQPTMEQRRDEVSRLIKS